MYENIHYKDLSLKKPLKSDFHKENDVSYFVQDLMIDELINFLGNIW